MRPEESRRLEIGLAGITPAMVLLTVQNEVLAGREIGMMVAFRANVMGVRIPDVPEFGFRVPENAFAAFAPFVLRGHPAVTLQGLEGYKSPVANCTHEVHGSMPAVRGADGIPSQLDHCA
jgi:hypothetical protein